MAKESAFGIRLQPEEKVALEQAAEADDRALSAMARKILVEWLIANGWMAERRKEPRPGSGGQSPN